MSLISWCKAPGINTFVISQLKVEVCWWCDTGMNGFVFYARKNESKKVYIVNCNVGLRVGKESKRNFDERQGSSTKAKQKSKAGKAQSRKWTKGTNNE